MKKKKLNHNFEFMFAIMAMAIVVFGVVVFFWMWCFPQGAAETISPMQRYEVLLETGFKGDSVQLQLNDSVMFAVRVTEDAVTVTSVSLTMRWSCLRIAESTTTRGAVRDV